MNDNDDVYIRLSMLTSKVNMRVDFERKCQGVMCVSRVNLLFK